MRKYVVPLPSLALMVKAGAPTVENFLVVGDVWSQVIGKLLIPGSVMLDIGCGCGRIPRFLVNFPGISYIGFDILKPSVDWCSENLTSKSNGRFRFYHVDGFSQYYNPNGSIEASQVKFPTEDATIDLAIAASVFTHLKEPDAKHYLEEGRRVLKAGGIALFSIHINTQPGCQFQGDEARIDIEPEYFVQLAQNANLKLKERIGKLCGQETFLFEAAK
ncbi:MAG: class I SAM-dependent methyltransferase [Candidatus Bathyarchaeia archaeon]